MNKTITTKNMYKREMSSRKRKKRNRLEFHVCFWEIHRKIETGTSKKEICERQRPLFRRGDYE